VLTEYHRACIGILERFETTRKLNNSSSESMALLRAYIVLFKKWGISVGLSFPPSDESAPTYPKRLASNEAERLMPWHIIRCVKLAMIIAFSMLGIGVERPTDSDLKSFLTCCYWAIGREGEVTEASSNKKANAQPLIQAGYIWEAVPFQEFEDRAKKQKIVGLPAQIEYIGMAVEVLYGVVPSEELGRDIKEYKLAIAGLFKQLSSTTSGTVHKSLPAIEY
jgi:hypothetical protein